MSGMAHSYRSPDRDQLLLLPPSRRDWVPEDHLVWLILELVSLFDLSGFHARHPNDGVGRRAYDPKMMLALLLYGYCIGLRSSRKIAAGCRGDLAFKVICADVVPHHDAIGRFRAEHEQAIGDLFVGVLMVCARAGLVSLGTIAIDGTKIAAAAALDQNRAESVIRAEVEAILIQAATADSAIDDPDGEQRWGGPGGRLGRLRAALVEIDTERARHQAEARSRADKLTSDAVSGLRPRGKLSADPRHAVVVAAADVTACEVRVELAGTDVLARVEALSQLDRAKVRLAGLATAAAVAPSEPERQANVVDPHSRIMKTAGGWVQGYNAQAAVTADQLIVAAALTQDHNDVNCYQLMIDAVSAATRAAGITAGVGTVVADAGYWSETNATSQGPDRLIATTKDYKQRRAARELGVTSGEPPPGLSALEVMEHRLRTPEGTAIYALRSHTVEPVFGQTKTNRGFREFMRRGLTAVTSEWQLICLTHNINKLYTQTKGQPLHQLLTDPTP